MEASPRGLCRQEGIPPRTVRISLTVSRNKLTTIIRIAGLSLVVHAEELNDLVKQYERSGFFDQLIDLLQASLGLGKYNIFSLPSFTFLSAVLLSSSCLLHF